MKTVGEFIREGRQIIADREKNEERKANLARQAREAEARQIGKLLIDTFGLLGKPCEEHLTRGIRSGEKPADDVCIEFKARGGVVLVQAWLSRGTNGLWTITGPLPFTVVDADGAEQSYATFAEAMAVAHAADQTLQ